MAPHVRAVSQVCYGGFGQKETGAAQYSKASFTPARCRSVIYPVKVMSPRPVRLARQYLRSGGVGFQTVGPSRYSRFSGGIRAFRGFCKDRKSVV